jgi:hypothetical protein
MTAKKKTAPREPRDVPGEFLFTVLTKLIYQSFAAAIREAVSNSYDANAKKIEISIDPLKKLKIAQPHDVRVTIADDGVGMSQDDFWAKYASIGSEKAPDQKDPETGRYPIGKFGIGAFALTPFVNQLLVFSKKDGCDAIQCAIDAPKLVDSNATKTNRTTSYKDHVKSNVTCTEITDKEWRTVAPDRKGAPGTVIVANGVTRATLDELNKGKAEYADLEEYAPDVDYMAKGVRQLLWVLESSLPLPYSNDLGGVAASSKAHLKSNNPSAKIFLCGNPLQRRIFSEEDSKPHSYSFTSDDKKVTARGVVLALSSGRVDPKRANGVLLRLNNVGVGNYTMPDAAGGNSTIRNRITGEIHILAGLHDELNAARTSFDGGGYDALKRDLDNFIRGVVSDANADWTQENERKKQEREKERKRRSDQLKREAEAKRKRAAAGKGNTAAGDTSGKATAGKYSGPNNEHVDFETLKSSLLKLYKSPKEHDVINNLLEVFDIEKVPAATQRAIVKGLISFRQPT